MADHRHVNHIPAKLPRALVERLTRPFSRFVQISAAVVARDAGVGFKGCVTIACVYPSRVRTATSVQRPQGFFGVVWRSGIYGQGPRRRLVQLPLFFMFLLRRERCWSRRQNKSPCGTLHTEGRSSRFEDRVHKPGVLAAEVVARADSDHARSRVPNVPA